MRYDDSTQAASGSDVTTLARADVDNLPPGVMGPATGNTITGADTITGIAGADSVAEPPAHIVAVQGAAGSDQSGADGFQVAGQYGVLTIDADGNYTYVRNPGAPDGASDVFQYTLEDHAGQQSVTTLTIELGSEMPSDAAQAALSNIPGIVNLPAGVELSDIHVVGRDLVIDLPDGGQMVIPGGAVFVPQLVIGDVELPATNLAALLIDSEPQPAAGSPLSSGGNFAVDVPPLDPGVPLGDLIPPTELNFTPPDFEDVGQFVDNEPTIVIVTPDNPAGAVNAVASVDEAGLAAREGEPEGSGEEAAAGDNGDPSEATSGTIVFEAEDGVDSITINGTAITSVGQTFAGAQGTLTITSIDLANGQIGFDYLL
ncbi:MAG TPA: VCBS domain-containing protein, partial [Sphingomicrobium sp.]|nr:VCBS domain-containing protein [Sphingomicrobium sp.]